MVRLIFSIIFLIILAVFIAFNATYSTGVNLFGYKMESVPTVAVVLLTLVVGVLYSFGLYVTSYFSKKQSSKAKTKKQKNAAKAKELEYQEKELKTARETLDKPKAENIPEPENLSAGVSGSSTSSGSPKKKKNLLRMKKK
jgi:uncharacterized integral membrane protein